MMGAVDLICYYKCFARDDLEISNMYCVHLLLQQRNRAFCLCSHMAAANKRTTRMQMAEKGMNFVCFFGLKFKGTRISGVEVGLRIVFCI